MFLPVLNLINIFIITNFVYRYYKVASTVYLLYNQDADERIMALKPTALKRKKIIINTIVGIIHLFQVISLALSIAAFATLDEDDVHLSERDRKYLKASIVFRNISEFLLFGL